MSKQLFFCRAFALSVLVAAPASGSIIFQTTGALNAADPTQLSRLSRSGVPSDWSSAKAYPGVLNPTISYHYETFTVNVGITPYVQISVDDPNAAIFVSAYNQSYVPATPGTNYLGDNGSSGNFTGNQPAFFQVMVPMDTNLVVLVNDVSASNGGIGRQFSLLVEGFIDTQYTDPVATPEPSILLLTSSGIGLIALTGWRRKRRGR